jgi:hypothetical protein
MTLLLPRMTPPADRPDALAPASRDADAGLQDIVIVPPPGQSVQRVRPAAETLVERLRKMQGWS